MSANARYIFGAILGLPLLPILYYQSMKLKSTMPDLPEAKGKEGSSETGNDKSLKIIAIGESTVAGVGVETNEEGFMGEFAKAMANGLDARISWKIYAKSGYTAEQIRKEIIPQINDESADLVIVGLGGNDSFKLKSPTAWRNQIEQLILDIRLKFPETPIAFTNIPPIKDFMAFTPLMKFAFGNMGEMLGDELNDISKNQVNIFYNAEKLTFELLSKRYGLNNELSDFFSDGVHPSKLTYQILARHFAEFLVSQIQSGKLQV